METKDIILELRTKHGLSQEELAEKVFVTRQAVSRWENGETIPNTETLKLLSGLFDVSINTLLGSPRELICQCCGMSLEDSNVSREKDGSFHSTMGAIYQTFGGRDLYPSVEEKAANLLYLTTKNHSFSDGNKRIAAFLFLWFMEKNGILYRQNGSRLIDNNTLVALTLMIAESRTEEKDIMTKVVVNLINKRN